MKTFGSVLLQCVLATGAAYAQCSSYVAPSGSDGSSGSATAPFATPQRAVDAAQPGAVICLRSGLYAITSYFGITKPVTLMSAPGEWAVLTADNSASSNVGSVVEVGAGNVTIQDVEIVGGAYYGIKISPDLLGIPPANVRVLRSKVHDTGRDGIKAYQADGLLIEGNEVYRTGVRDSSNADGIDVMASIPVTNDPAGWGVIVRGNYIHHTATYGMYLKGGTRRGLVQRNRIDQTSGAGLALGQDSGQEYMRDGALYECIDCTAINNVVTNAQQSGLMCMAGWNIRFENNHVINVAIAGQAGLFSGPNHNNLGCGNAVYRNNAVSVSSRRPLVHMVQPSGAITLDYNGYYRTDGTVSFWWEVPTGNYYLNSLEQWRAALGQDLHSFAAPLQLDADLKPASGSPLIDRGVTIADIGFDFAGTVRPQGSAYDIGAYEVNAGAPPPPPPAAASTTTSMQDGTLRAAKKPQKYTLQAQVASGTEVVNGGVVRFTVDGASVGTATVSNGTASMAYVFRKTSAGTRYSLQAFYEGTSAFEPSASNVATLTIVP